MCESQWIKQDKRLTSDCDTSDMFDLSSGVDRCYSVVTAQIKADIGRLQNINVVFFDDKVQFDIVSVKLHFRFWFTGHLHSQLKW